MRMQEALAGIRELLVLMWTDVTGGLEASKTETAAKASNSRRISPPGDTDAIVKAHRKQQ
jgi:hypothetical protein